MYIKVEGRDAMLESLRHPVAGLQTGDTKNLFSFQQSQVWS